MVRRKQTNRVIFHHSLSDTGDVELIRSWHLARKFEEIGYHFVILPDGTLQEGRKLALAGAHALGRNSDSIGVCLVSDFRKNPPTNAQIAECCNLYHSLCRAYSKALKIEFHRPHVFNLFERGAYNRFDACPGRMLNRAEFVKAVGRYNPYT